MTTTELPQVQRITPPIGRLTDMIRLAFHTKTNMVLPNEICQACWLNMVGMVTGAIDRDAILRVEHGCPHYVEPDMVFFHALEGMPPEEYWSMVNPWSEAL
ncbi:hypothetical protein [Arthrobacter sp. 2MCAF14]|uniref:hypothetical protein n=1 Tax=Arthrobacter sp. 2MCAF14 TaxID=3232982 RepID=UPI003F8E2349